MRWGIVAFLIALFAAGSASAQSEITLRADPIAVVEAEINRRPVRLEVDLRFPRGLALSNDAAERLRVRRMPLLGIRIGIEGSDATLGGRIARPRIRFPGRAEDETESTRAFSGVFPVPASRVADGLIGPGVLPYDVVTVVLGAEAASSRDIVFTLDDADEWEAAVTVGGEQIRVNFNPANQASILNRSAARLFDRSGAITAVGELREVPLILGLTTLMQPVETQLSVEGLTLGSAFARTNAPLLGATEEDAVVVSTEARDPPPPILTLGREALSRCSSIRVNRPARRLTLRCAV